MGNIMIALRDDTEMLLRNLAREKYGGKKGSISAVVEDAIEKLSKDEKRLRAAHHQIALMRKGFDLGLGKKKLYEKRSELYD